MLRLRDRPHRQLARLEGELPEEPELELGRAAALTDERLAVHEARVEPHLEPRNARIDRDVEAPVDLVHELHARRAPRHTAAWRWDLTAW